MEIESIIGDYKTFLDGVFENLKTAGFDLSEFAELDHIAYRTESIERYEEIKNELLDFSESHDDKVFNGRRILVCRLKKPLIYKNLSIAGLEVLAPKENNKFKDGLEHAEFVIKIALPEFREKHNSVDFNLDAYGREENRELSVGVGSCVAKFHEQSLLEIRRI